jgi:hypothetical protein
MGVAAKAVSKDVMSKVKYLPQRLNTVQNIMISILCMLERGDAEGAIAPLRESHDYLKMIIKDVEDLLRELEGKRAPRL